MSALLLAVCVASVRAQSVTGAQSWPHSIPCRIANGANPDLFVMTLGDVQTPIVGGVFNALNDEVTLKDGTVKTNYYRDTLGVKSYLNSEIEYDVQALYEKFTAQADWIEPKLVRKKD